MLYLHILILSSSCLQCNFKQLNIYSFSFYMRTMKCFYEKNRDKMDSSNINTVKRYKYIFNQSLPLYEQLLHFAWKYLNGFSGLRLHYNKISIFFFWSWWKYALDQSLINAGVPLIPHFKKNNCLLAHRLHSGRS